MMRDLLIHKGIILGQRAYTYFNEEMGPQALYCKPNLSQANQAHRDFRVSLLKGLAILAVIKCGVRI